MMKKSPLHTNQKPVVIEEMPTQQKPTQPIRTNEKSKKKVKRNDNIPSWYQQKEMSQRMEFQKEGIRSTQNIIQAVDPQQHSPYEINTAEDLRKAIVWSEILKRKY
ncbi:MAG: hypothetical protein K5856_03170 [Bacteroidaceae bacterium]|nr:hypothetical protein [Bacteroidaceae bacterium]